MAKIKKLKKRNKYQFNVNRKRMKKKRLAQTESSAVLKAWDSRTSSQKNLKRMGLEFDVNRDIKSMNRDGDSNVENLKVKDSVAVTVLNDLEKIAETVPQGHNSFRFSKDQVDFLTYLLNKYGEDYKAMSRDKKNYLQLTWRKIRYKINLFKSIPQHYNEYLKNYSVEPKL